MVGSGRWVLGYHGCDRSIGEAVLAGDTELVQSDNDWDWLGKGIYFWENSAQRALEWAQLAKGQPGQASTHAPFVVGAIIDLGFCLDLLDAASIPLIADAHLELSNLFSAAGSPLPTNAGTHPDRVIRRLDCAVINYIHDARERRNEPQFDSVRAAFLEGEPVYAGAGFHSRTHIQISVRKSSQIIGYFRVKERR